MVAFDYSRAPATAELRLAFLLHLLQHVLDVDDLDAFRRLARRHSGRDAVVVRTALTL